MPHQTIEYSENLEAIVDIKALVNVLHDTAASVDALPLAGLRTRAVARHHYRIADGHPDNLFVNVALRIAPGRPADVRKEAGQKLFDALCEFLEPVYSSSPLALSYEIQELDAEMRWKKGNIREYLAQRKEDQ